MRSPLSYATRTGKSGYQVAGILALAWIAQTILGTMIIMWTSAIVMGAFDRPGFGILASILLTILLTVYRSITGGFSDERTRGPRHSAIKR